MKIKHLVRNILIAIIYGGLMWSAGWVSARIYFSSRIEAVQVKSTVRDSKPAKSMLTLINEERMKTGVAEVLFDEQIAAAAKTKACDMRDRGYFDHQDPQGRWGWHFLNEQGVSYRSAGENLAKEKKERIPDAQEDMLSLMASPEHKSIILDPKYTKVGYGSCGIYTVQFFVK